MQKTLIVPDMVIALIGFGWPWLSSLPIGRLPGDIGIERENFRLYFPVTTMIVVSIVLTLLIGIYRQL